MLDREEVVLLYKGLFKAKLGGDHPAFNWLDRLPPYLCRALILGDGLAAASRSMPAAFLGSRQGKLVNVGGIGMCVDGFGDRLFRSLPLAGHTPLSVPGLSDWLAVAMKLLIAIEPSAFKFIQDWCSVVLWVAPSQENPPDVLVTSVAIPTLPHCTIISVKSMRHIPANHVYEGASIYALAENIFHEALHQKLSSSLVFGLPLSNQNHSGAGTSIKIPWRETEWQLDRALHAAWVYSNLQRIRRKAIFSGLLDAPESGFVQGAIDESTFKLEYLRNALIKSKKKLSDSAQGLISDVLANSNI